MAKKLKAKLTLFLLHKKMSIPMYFVVSYEPGDSHDEQDFKLYQNSIYHRPNGFRQNVIWPIDNARGNCLIIRQTNINENSSIIRKWNGSETNSLTWSFTGSSMEILLEAYGILINAPIVFIDAENKEFLPYNSHSFCPNDIKFFEEQEIYNYTPAKIFRTDPNSPENTSPIPSIQVRHPLVSTSTPISTLRQITISSPAPAIRQSSLPPHITKIVLADAIKKNEVCPITSENITEVNATVTCCGHVFTTSAIRHWLSLSSSRGECPICKQKC